jgi:hypothetical protein
LESAVLSLLLIFLLLIASLTGLIVPLMVVGGWLLVGVIGIALVVGFAGALIRLAVSPLALVVLAYDWIRGAPPKKTTSHPQPGEPGYYAWANRLGEHPVHPAFVDMNDQSPGAQLRRRIAARRTTA